MEKCYAVFLKSFDVSHNNRFIGWTPNQGLAQLCVTNYIPSAKNVYDGTLMNYSDLTDWIRMNMVIQEVPIYSHLVQDDDDELQYYGRDSDNHPVVLNKVTIDLFEDLCVRKIVLDLFDRMSRIIINMVTLISNLVTAQSDTDVSDIKSALYNLALVIFNLEDTIVSLINNGSVIDNRDILCRYINFASLYVYHVTHCNEYNGD